MSVRLSTGLPARLLRAHVGRGAENHARRVVPIRRRAVGDRDDRRRLLAARRLRQPEVEHLHRAVRRDLDVRRLQIAMDDALLVRGFERLGDLPRDRADASSSGTGPARNRSASVVAFDELQHERADAVRLSSNP